MTGGLPSRAHLAEVWALSLPVILGNLLQSLVNVTDVFLAGRLGPVEIAAVGMATSVRMLLLVGVMAVTAGSMALAAQARGAADAGELSRVARQSLTLALLLSLVLGLVGFLAAEPLMRFLNSGGQPQAVAAGAAYLEILFAGSAFLILNFTVNSLMQGAGDTLTPLYLSAGVSLGNVALSALLMFGPGPLPALGVAGAALGTVASRALAVAAGLWLLYSGRNVVRILPGSYRPDLPTFRNILAIGLPSGLQGVARNAAQVLVLRIVTATAAGTYGATALAIGLQVESLAFMPGLAISVAATSLVGQKLGAWQPAEARARGDASVWLGVVVMGSIGAVLFTLAPQLVRLFDPTAHPVVLAAGISYLRINALAQPLLAVAMILNGALRGAGDTRPGLVGTVVGRWLVVVPLALLLALRLDLGPEGVWWALFAGTAVQAAWVAARWRSGRWSEVSLRTSRLYREHLHRLPRGLQQRYLDELRTPLLASRARERVEPDRVTYELPCGSVQFGFDGRLQLLAGEQVLERLRLHVPARAAEALPGPGAR